MRAAARAAVCGEQGLPRDGGEEPTELRRTLIVKWPTLGERAAARAAVCGEQGLLRDGEEEPTELNRTLIVKCPTLGVRAAARAAVCGEQGLLRDGGGESCPPLLHCLEPPPVSHILMLLHNVNQHNINVTWHNVAKRSCTQRKELQSVNFQKCKRHIMYSVKKRIPLQNVL